MGRQKGSKNKEKKQPAVLAMPEEARIKLLANIILEIVAEENAAQ